MKNYRRYCYTKRCLVERPFAMHSVEVRDVLGDMLLAYRKHGRSVYFVNFVKGRNHEIEFKQTSRNFSVRLDFSFDVARWN